MTFAAGSATVDQVLSALALLATSNSYGLELAALKVEMSSPLALSMDNLSGPDQEVLSLDDSSLAGTIPDSFAAVYTDYKTQRPGAMPAIMLWSAPSHLWVPGNEAERNPGYQGFVHKVRMVCFAEHETSPFARQTAGAMATAFCRLVRRNEELGGLVFQIEADGPPEVVTDMDRGTVAAAGCEFDAKVIYPG